MLHPDYLDVGSGPIVTGRDQRGALATAPEVLFLVQPRRKPPRKRHRAHPSPQNPRTPQL